MKKIFIVILFSFVFAQVTTDLSFNTSRKISMVGAAVSDPSYGESVFINPAGLSQVSEDMEFLFGTTEFYGLDFIYYSYLSFVFPSDIGNFGISVQRLGVRPSSDYSFLNDEHSLSISQGFSLLKDKNSTLDLGYTFNLFSIIQGASAGISGDGSDGLPSKQIYSYGIDIGVLTSLRDKIKIGAFIKNINSPSIGKGSSLQYLPRKLSIGLSYIPNKNLSSHFNLERLLGYEDLHFRFGFEYIFNKMFTMRSGIQMKPNCIGFGFDISPAELLTISFGIMTGPVMPTTQNIEFKFKF